MCGQRASPCLLVRPRAQKVRRSLRGINLAEANAPFGMTLGSVLDEKGFIGPGLAFPVPPGANRANRNVKKLCSFFVAHFSDKCGEVHYPT